MKQARKLCCKETFKSKTVFALKRLNHLTLKKAHSYQKYKIHYNTFKDVCLNNKQTKC